MLLFACVFMWHLYIYCWSFLNSFLGVKGSRGILAAVVPRSCLAYFWVQIFSYTADSFANIEAKVSIFRQGNLAIPQGDGQWMVVIGGSLG